MRIKVLDFSSLLLGTLLLSTLSLAQEDGWQTLDSVQARSTHQTINLLIPEAFQGKSIASIRFHAANGDIRMNYAKLFLNDGDNINFSIQRTVHAGHNSRMIPVKIGNRTLTKVSLFYRVQQKDNVRVTLQAQLSEEN
ncbi:hypothetical protein [Endozoicomonas euniceicola]|uniref:Uncharacterized protein n=1 Tax=Endozoicomonas euniceicola TaxID=1234143 RepID=A0ABY6H235_9GAMM|nr:hypothetical protein [Endozoicomonas euniceicola]UYM18669.1 hypothetical protein NX720_12445 [Endozoicomonas euniceicola]